MDHTARQKVEEHERRVQTAKGLIVAFLTFGTLFFGVLEEWGLGNAFYFSWITLTTIGAFDINSFRCV